MRRYCVGGYGHCERILAPSDATRTMLTDSGISPSRIDIWRRGVSTMLFDPRKRSAAMRERWGVSDRRPALVYVGRLSKEKGLHALVPITRTLDYGGIDYRLVVVGDGPLGSELRTVSGAVFTGTLAHEEVAVALAQPTSSCFRVGPTQLGMSCSRRRRAAPCARHRCRRASGKPRSGRLRFVCRNEIDFARRAAESIRNQNKRRQFGDAARRYRAHASLGISARPPYRAYAAAGLELSGRPSARRPQSPPSDIRAHHVQRQ